MVNHNHALKHERPDERTTRHVESYFGCQFGRHNPICLAFCLPSDWQEGQTLRVEKEGSPRSRSSHRLTDSGSESTCINLHMAQKVIIDIEVLHNLAITGHTTRFGNGFTVIHHALEMEFEGFFHEIGLVFPSSPRNKFVGKWG